MKAVLIHEIEASNDPTELERYAKFLNEEWVPYLEKLDKTDVKYTRSVWNDNSGTTFIWMEFETVEGFAKVWGEMDFQRLMSHRALLVKCKVRLLRPGIRD